MHMTICVDMSKPKPRKITKTMETTVDSTQCIQNLENTIATVSESPFTWLSEFDRQSIFSYVDSDYLINRCAHIEGKRGLNVYAKYMCLVYELENKKQDNVLEKLEEWRQFLEESTGNNLICKLKPALQQVLLSSEAHLFMKRGEYSKVKQVIQQLKTATSDTDIYKAAVFGLKAKFFQKYGSKGHKEALVFAKKALEFDENEPEWIAVTAKNLRDIRRSELYNTDNDFARNSLMEEYNLYKKLTELPGQRPVHFLRFGNTLHDLATLSIVSKRHSPYVENIKLEIEDNCRRGIRYFLQAEACETPVSVKTYLRLIRGLNTMPRNYGKKFLSLGDRWVDMVLKLSEEDKLHNHHHQDVIFAVGKYYQNLKEDNQSAKELFEKAVKLGSINAKKELIIMKFKSDPSYNPCNDIEERMEIFPDNPRLLESLCQIASFYLVIKRNCVEAVETMNKILHHDPTASSLYITKHKSWFIFMEEHINLLEVLANEVLILLRNESQIEAEFIDSDILCNFIISMQNATPELLAEVQSNLDPNKITKLLQVANTKKECRHTNHHQRRQINKVQQNHNWRDECRHFK